jgi:hypothetical protein
VANRLLPGSSTSIASAAGWPRDHGSHRKKRSDKPPRASLLRYGSFGRRRRGGVRQVLYDVAGVARPVLAEADQPDAEHWACVEVRGARASIE